jgi:MFS family permease
MSARFLVSAAYARLWAGQAASALGDAVLLTGAVVWVDRTLAAGQPWAAAAVSGVPAVSYAAVAVAGPLAGPVVDRLDRRAVMCATELARAALAAALAALTIVPAGRLPAGAWLAALYAALAGLAGAGQFFGPARTAVIASLAAGEADRARAAGLAEAAASAASMAGPLIAVPLTLAGGIRWALLIDAASYLASWLSVRGLPPQRPARPAPGGFRAGVRAFARSRPLTALLSVTVPCQLGAGALTALGVVAVVTDLHGTVRDWGTAEALMGAGYVVGAAAAGRLVRAAGVRTVVCGGLFTAAALTAAYALARDVPLGLAILACYGAAISVLNTASYPLIMAGAPDEYLGRAVALFAPANQAAGAVSVAVAGWLASGPLSGFRAVGGIGPVSLLMLAGAVLIAAAGGRAVAALPGKDGDQPA